MRKISIVSLFWLILGLTLIACEPEIQSNAIAGGVTAPSVLCPTSAIDCIRAWNGAQVKLFAGAGVSQTVGINGATGNITATGRITASTSLGLGTGAADSTYDFVWVRVPMLSMYTTYTKTEPLSYKTHFFGEDRYQGIAPDADSPGSYYQSRSATYVPASNTRAIGSVAEMEHSVALDGTGVVTNTDGLIVSVSNSLTGTASAGSIKGLWSNTRNNGLVTSFYYGTQSNVDNSANVLGAGNIATAVAARLRVQNATQSTATGAANITTAQLIAGNIANSTNGSNYTSTIGTAEGLRLQFTNSTTATIGTSYYINLLAPTNGTVGNWQNHYGIYLGDQTVAGTTNNYALYSAGGQSYHAGNIGVGVNMTSPQATLDISGTARLLKYGSQPFVCTAAKDGAIALTTGYKLCVCNSSAWVQTSDGVSGCSW